MARRLAARPGPSPDAEHHARRSLHGLQHGTGVRRLHMTGRRLPRGSRYVQDWPRCRWAAAGPHKASQRSSRDTSGVTSNTTTGATPTRPSMQKTDIHNRMSACGGARGIRTPDLLIANETRYQLRHSPKDGYTLAPSEVFTQADRNQRTFAP